MTHVPFNQAHVALKGADANLPRTTKVKISGKVVTLYSLGYLAATTGKSNRMLRVYERDRILPRPLITAPSGIRWYLADEIKEFGLLFKSYAPRQGARADLNPTDRNSFKEKLAQCRIKIRNKMNSDINLIQTAMQDAPQVANIARLCKVNRRLAKITA